MNGELKIMNNIRSGHGITEIVWQYPSPGGLGSGFNDTKNALGAMLEWNKNRGGTGK
jgi:hypothetical protein